MLHHCAPLALSSTGRPYISIEFRSSHGSLQRSNCANYKRRICVQSSWTFHRNRKECADGTPSKWEFGKVQEKMVEFGRCAFVTSAAALLVQFVACEAYLETASAATLPSASLKTSYSSFRNLENIDEAKCITSPSPFSTPVRKSRAGGGIHGKKSASVLGGGVEQTSLPAGPRRGLHLVKRSSPAYYQFRENFVARQLVVCSSASALPLASLSPALGANSLATLARLASRLDFSVLRSSFGTSFNLLSLCSLVVWLQRSESLPAETPVILSQVAFRLFIPCFLMSKVATTLISQPAQNLIALPLMAVAQVITGAVLGKLACLVFFREPTLKPSVEWTSSDGSESSSLAAEYKEQQIQISRTGATKKQALIVAACAFNNSLTLPLVFLTGVLGSSEEVSRAAGYLALYMVGWSPAMWTVGYKILTSGDEVQVAESSDGRSWWETVSKLIGNVMNPPLYGVLIGLLIGGTPLSHLFLGSREGIALTASQFGTVGALAKLRSVSAGILSPVFEAVSLLGTATLAVQTVVLATSLGASLPKITEKSSVKSSPKEMDPKEVEVVDEKEANLVKSQSALDSKSFWVISFVRLLIMPFVGVCFVTALTKANVLPPDSVYKLTVLTECAMPTAQNLVLMAQLNAGTRPLAGTLANLLLRQYALSVIPVTLWMAIFLALPSL
ncbi:hypothetical protein R1flu_007478 [Riccia fluitans]|uniref:PIN-like protein n=1 Tax=Riccia fluitans TaxID=41844 RepID=A0ABD1Z054_9MARC